MPSKNTSKNKLLLSTDTLPGFGLDLVFEVAKEVGFDGIDLALWKNYDARNTSYVKKLSDKHGLPVCVVQVSNSTTIKEMNQALDICEATGADTVSINAPTFFNFKAYGMLQDNLSKYREEHPDTKFGIINPEDANFFALPIPKFRYANLVEIVKKHASYLALDVANLDADSFEDDFMRKVSQFVPYISVIYLADKTKLNKSHVLPGDGVLKLGSFLKKVKQASYDRYFSIRLSLDKKDLHDTEKVIILLKKAKDYYDEYFVNAKLS